MVVKLNLPSRATQNEYDLATAIFWAAAPYRSTACGVTLPNLRRGNGRRNRSVARGRTTIIDPKRHPLNTIRHRGNGKSESKQHQRFSRCAGAIFDALALFSTRLRHSRFADIIRDSLTPFLMRFRHSGTFIRKIRGIFCRPVIDL